VSDYEARPALHPAERQRAQDATKSELLDWAQGRRPDLDAPMTKEALKRCLLELERIARDIRAILEML